MKLHGALFISPTLDDSGNAFVYLPLDGSKTELRPADKIPPEVLAQLLDISDSNEGTLLAVLVDLEG